MTLLKVFNISYPSYCSLLFPVLSSLTYLILSVPLFPFITSFYLPAPENPPNPWPFISFLITMNIQNETHIFKDSKLQATYVREHVIFIFLGMVYLTQDECLQFHSFTYEFHSFLFLKLNNILLYKHIIFSLFIHHLMSTQIMFYYYSAK